MSGHPMINNADWLRGAAAYERGEGCPWGNESARQGWLDAELHDYIATRRCVEGEDES